jgi:PleD family two-component response regulator
MENSARKTIVIVDDSASIRKEVKAVLEKNSFAVREAGSGFGLFSIIDEYGVLADMILMDVVLNEEDGFDLVTKLRNVERFRNIPVIMLTQRSDRDSVTMAKLLGVQGYIIKPIDPGLLLERVRKALEEGTAV